MNTRTVNLRNLPDDLVRRAKAVAAWKGLSLKGFIIQAIEQSLANQHVGAALFVTRGKRKKH